MPITKVLAGMAVRDFDAALAWYGRFFDRPADARPMDGLAEWHFGDSGGLQVFQDADHAGTALLTLAVDDLEGRVAALEGRGFSPGEITTGVVARFAPVTDPDGNTITLAETRPA